MNEILHADSKSSWTEEQLSEHQRKQQVNDVTMEYADGFREFRKVVQRKSIKEVQKANTA